jgi:serine/threonine-protein kinase
LSYGRWTRVYRARPLDSPLAGAGDFVVKTLPPERAADPLARALLRREAAVSRMVQHPHLTNVLIDETIAELPRLVLPYLPGVAASDLVQTAVLGTDEREVRLPVATACMLARQTAEALAALHERGWLHGDVQPANMLVAASGHTTLLDLGLARRLESDECQSEFFAGLTASYASPESFLPLRRLTAAADLYSLGIVLFELLAGRPPFAASQPNELARLHCQAPVPDLRQLRPAMTPELAELLRRMLAKEPLRRPSAGQTARWLAELEIEEVSFR